MMRLVDLILILHILISVESTADTLKCYQCVVTNNHECTDEYLKACPDNQAYDSCMSRISKTKEEGFLIHKTCALGPCRLRDRQQNEGLGLDDCDRGKEEYDCITCCKGDGCNTSGGTIYRADEALIRISAFVLAVALRTLHF